MKSIVPILFSFLMASILLCEDRFNPITAFSDATGQKVISLSLFPQSGFEKIGMAFEFQSSDGVGNISLLRYSDPEDVKNLQSTIDGMLGNAVDARNSVTKWKDATAILGDHAGKAGLMKSLGESGRYSLAYYCLTKDNYAILLSYSGDDERLCHQILDGTLRRGLHEACVKFAEDYSKVKTNDGIK